MKRAATILLATLIVFSSVAIAKSQRSRPAGRRTTQNRMNTGNSNSVLLPNRSPLGGSPEVGRQSGHLAIKPVHGSDVSAAQPDGVLDQRVEHRLQLDRRAADDLQHLGRRRLLL